MEYSTSYYQIVREGMETQAQTAASFLRNYASEREFLTAARYYMNEDFSNARLELQILTPADEEVVGKPHQGQHAHGNGGGDDDDEHRCATRRA